MPGPLHRLGNPLRHRLSTYQGQDVDIFAHVKYGVRPPKLLRVHYWVDRANKKIVIGHIGDHLETRATRRTN